MRLTITADRPQALQRIGKQYDRAEQRGMHVAIDRATRLAQKAIQQRIKAVGLGRLGGAVRSTSSERKKRRDPNNAWGAIYAAGGDESRAGGALEAYTQGATIRGRNVQWLAIPTRALPKRIGRFRMTPKRYEAAGNPLGPLVFKLVTRNRAYLIAQGDFTTSAKTGRAKPFKGRVSRGRQKRRDIIAFVLIKETKRAKRFDQRDLVRLAHAQMPKFLQEEIAKSLPAGLERG